MQSLKADIKGGIWANEAHSTAKNGCIKCTYKSIDRTSVAPQVLLGSILANENADKNRYRWNHLQVGYVLPASRKNIPYKGFTYAPSSSLSDLVLQRNVITTLRLSCLKVVEHYGSMTTRMSTLEILRPRHTTLLTRIRLSADLYDCTASLASMNDGRKRRRSGEVVGRMYSSSRTKARNKRRVGLLMAPKYTQLRDLQVSNFSS